MFKINFLQIYVFHRVTAWFNTSDEMAYSERFTIESNVIWFIEQ